MEIVERRDCQSEWDDAIDKHPLGWFWHTSRWIEYSLAYTDDAKDVSFAVFDGGQCMAVVPLVVSRRTGALVMGGQMTPEPLFFAMAAKTVGFVYDTAIYRLGRQPLPVQLRPGIIPKAIERAPETAFREHGTYVLDLRLPEATLWHGVRRSYKHLIRQSEKTVKSVCVTEGKSSDSEASCWIQMAHAIHRAAAGRETRAEITWALMGEWLTDGYATMTIINDEAYAYVIRYKDWSYYASGASLSHDGAGAHAQWESIKRLRSSGIVFYELGQSENEHSTEKDRGIAFFKRGFGAVEWPQIVMAAREELL